MRKIYILLICIVIISGCRNTNDSGKSADSSLTWYNNVIEVINYLDNSGDKLVGTNKVNLYLFYSSTCPHCHAEIEWLNTIKDRYPYLNIIEYEASDHFQLYESVVEQMKINDYHVPLTIIGSDYYVGFNEYKQDDIIKLIEKYSKYEHCDMVNTIEEEKDIMKCDAINHK